MYASQETINVLSDIAILARGYSQETEQQYRNLVALARAGAVAPIREQAASKAIETENPVFALALLVPQKAISARSVMKRDAQGTYRFMSSEIKKYEAHVQKNGKIVWKKIENGFRTNSTIELVGYLKQKKDIEGFRVILSLRHGQAWTR